MRFKDFLKESIIDIPRKTYARPVFDNAETSNPTLKPSGRKQILDGIKPFATFGKGWTRRVTETTEMAVAMSK